MIARRQLPDGTIVSCAGPPSCPYCVSGGPAVYHEPPPRLTREDVARVYGVDPAAIGHAAAAFRRDVERYRGDVAGLFDVPPEALRLPAAEGIAVNMLPEAFPSATVSRGLPDDEEDEPRACANCGDLVEFGLSSRDWCDGCEEEAYTAPRNPEQDVIDEIDRLVDEQMATGAPPEQAPDLCPRCGSSWHGLRRGRCPGATGIEGNPDEAARRDSDVFAHGQETYNSETSAPPGALGYRTRPGTADIRARPVPPRLFGDPSRRPGDSIYPDVLLFPRPLQPQFTIADSGDRTVTIPTVSVRTRVAPGNMPELDRYDFSLVATDTISGAREERRFFFAAELLVSAPDGASLGSFFIEMLGCRVNVVLRGSRVIAELVAPFGRGDVVCMGFGL